MKGKEPADWLIVCPDYPPHPGGVADHTANLAGHLSRAQNGKVTVLTSRSDAPGSDAVLRSIDNWSSPVHLLAQFEKIDPGQTRLLWQYVPHMYGRGGVNKALPKVIAALKARGFHQTVLAHEIQAPYSLWPQRFYYAQQHRSQWKKISHLANKIGISTEAWLLRIQKLQPSIASKVFLSPSPSNVPVEKSDRGPSARVVLTFASATSSSLWEKCSSLPGVKIESIGAKILQPAFNSFIHPLGHLSLPEISQRLSSADLVVLPYVDGVSERRTTFTAALAHSCAVLTTAAQSTGPKLRSASYLRWVAADDPANFIAQLTTLLDDSMAKLKLGQAARIAYEKQYDWPILVQRLLGFDHPE